MHWIAGRGLSLIEGLKAKADELRGAK
jgi:hypothetical protein